LSKSGSWLSTSLDCGGKLIQFGESRAVNRKETLDDLFQTHKIDSSHTLTTGRVCW
jgi:hypothetical protein